MYNSLAYYNGHKIREFLNDTYGHNFKVNCSKKIMLDVINQNGYILNDDLKRDYIQEGTEKRKAYYEKIREKKKAYFKEYRARKKAEKMALNIVGSQSSDSE